MLHVILIFMDERDQGLLAAWQGSELSRAQPRGWTPFLTDKSLENWRDLIAQQIQPDGHSQTLEIFGARANRSPAELRALLDDSRAMQESLWQHIPQELLASTEAAMYKHALIQTSTYLNEARILAR